MRGAILATAAKAHFRHDFTGRALKRPANDHSPLAFPVPPTASATSPGTACLVDKPERAGALSPFHHSLKQGH